ncbi:SH3 domain-containing protein [Micromonospora sp. WMMD987]|uniref:SH3 domain-containing protein n=1 Tax=Micromonospora sp. WMMD987 TaxID=3016089 RepID=UPI00249AE2AC|nr:SH3 domain-containing protein [Micromonospora sp. WMMD987]WFE92692.1 SH3 domain-containing protein [Micromonospora sp. WMMD987]
MQRLKRATISAGVLMAATAIVPVVSASPASAHAPCGVSVDDKDSRTWRATGGGANMRSGSSTSCSIKGTAGSGQRLDYHCYTLGKDGHTWTFLRNDSTGKTGWVRDDLLSDGGSFEDCGL